MSDCSELEVELLEENGWDYHEALHDLLGRYAAVNEAIDRLHGVATKGASM